MKWILYLLTWIIYNWSGINQTLKLIYQPCQPRRVLAHSTTYGSRSANKLTNDKKMVKKNNLTISFGVFLSLCCQQISCRELSLQFGYHYHVTCPPKSGSDCVSSGNISKFSICSSSATVLLLYWSTYWWLISIFSFQSSFVLLLVLLLMAKYRNYTWRLGEQLYYTGVLLHGKPASCWTNI